MLVFERGCAACMQSITYIAEPVAERPGILVKVACMWSAGFYWHSIAYTRAAGKHYCIICTHACHRIHPECLQTYASLAVKQTLLLILRQETLHALCVIHGT